MDKDTLTRLLAGGHLNMEERIRRGLWPHAPIPYAEVVEHLAEVLRTSRWFPVPWKPHRPGELVREGGTIENADGRFIYRGMAAHPLAPTVVNGESERIFDSAREAAEHYLKWDLHLPGSLDGWRVE